MELPPGKGDGGVRKRAERANARRAQTDRRHRRDSGLREAKAAERPPGV
jgi:hypothetical protein